MPVNAILFGVFALFFASIYYRNEHVIYIRI